MEQTAFSYLMTIIIYFSTMEKEIFSKRIGIHQEMANIVIRNDAPAELRSFLLLIIKDYIKSLKQIRAIVCKTINEAPDPSNWGENNFMDSEIQVHLDNCKWFRIYDVIENFYKEIDSIKQISFENKINEFFYEKGIGWKLEQGTIVSRGDDYFERALDETKTILNEKGLATSKNEITEAIADLSRRPIPEITGAVQHALAALECVCRELTGSNDTLGKLIKNYTDLVPKPLDVAIDKMFGYASEHGRHLHEGSEPSYDEAFLLVHISASLCTYLANKQIGGTGI